MAADLMEERLLPWKQPDQLLRTLAALDSGAARDHEASIARLLSHTDDEVREEAVRALFVVGKSTGYRDQLLDLFCSDPASEVKCAAAYAIAQTSTASSRQKDQRFLLRAVRDASEELPVRASAYDALLIMHRRPEFPSKLAKFDPARDIDWQWVGSLEVPDN